MTIYKIFQKHSSQPLPGVISDSGRFVEYVIRKGHTQTLTVLEENNYDPETYGVKLVSSQEVIDHYKELRDEQKVVFEIVEKIMREHEKEESHG